MKFTIPLKKCKTSIVIETTDYPKNIQDGNEFYGWKQKINDALAPYSLTGTDSTTKATPEEMLDVVNKTLARWSNGDYRASRTVDSVAKMAMKMALTKVTNDWLKANPTRDVKEYDTRTADANAHLELHPELTKLAEQIVAATAADSDVE